LTRATTSSSTKQMSYPFDETDTNSYRTFTVVIPLLELVCCCQVFSIPA
jgi:hypothetical protein